MKTHGLHHVTAITGDAQRNLDFYTQVLGLRLVKKTVNFDDPSSYHFYFGDAFGTPGSILTFFVIPGARPGTRGTGEISATAYAIPGGSTGYWVERLKAYGVLTESISTRFGEEVIRLADPEGMIIELIATDKVPAPQGDRSAIPQWAENPVPVEHEIRSFHSVTASIGRVPSTTRLLTDVLGYKLVGEESERTRYTAPGTDGLPGHPFDVLATPGMQRGRQSAGSVHHVALRLKDDAEQQAWLSRLASNGYRTSPVMDRMYFHSIYFRDHSGILFELATNPPGFTHDETVETLGTTLRLPPGLEGARRQIEGMLPPITPFVSEVAPAL
ncbi:ring-cleaving dioxygenase [Verrucomicrobia bacterium LW23]|nr:ring-cleaving dioxygenase [Verrucomicrobia bacterium LW23]